ncbi:MAG TPA: hypothetical protein VGA10_12120, partial [Thermoanaerobaculia bacterium]
PHAAVDLRHVQDRRRTGHASNGAAATAAEWADHPPAHFLKRCRIKRLRDRVGGDEDGQQDVTKSNHYFPPQGVGNYHY